MLKGTVSRVICTEACKGFYNLRLTTCCSAAWRYRLTFGPLPSFRYATVLRLRIRCLFYMRFKYSSSCAGYSEFGYHLNKTGRAMVYSCSWPVYQTYAGLQVSSSYIRHITGTIRINYKIVVASSFRRDRAKIFSFCFTTGTTHIK